MLRLFDKARRDLSMQLTETEGVGAGYDRLRVEWEEVSKIEVGAVVTITAIVSAVSAVRHSVDYLATAKPGQRGGAHVLLAQANGWTVAAADP